VIWPLLLALGAGDGGHLARGQACRAAPADVAASARWFLARPIAGDYSNPGACPPARRSDGCHDLIGYDVTELESARGKLELEGSAPPALAALGPHRLAMSVEWEGRLLIWPEGSSLHATDASLPAWLELVIGRDQGYVGRLTELLGVPFVLGPASLPDLGHQTDLRLGTDCVALAIYGRRRLGERWPHVAPAVLLEWLEPVGSAPALVDAEGRVADVGAVQEGDVLHFGFQTAVLARDNPPRGRLDATDIVIHAYHGLVEELPLARLPYRAQAVDVLRWPGPSRAP
jgi:hypothetical protein